MFEHSSMRCIDEAKGGAAGTHFKSEPANHLMLENPPIRRVSGFESKFEKNLPRIFQEHSKKFLRIFQKESTTQRCRGGSAERERADGEGFSLGSWRSHTKKHHITIFF